MELATAEQFLTHLEKSNLLSADQLAAARTSVPAGDTGCRNLIKTLVQRSLLTPWQVQQLLAGRHAFFLGKYKLLDRIGVGGMGAVFKAQHTTMGRMVALKVMSQNLVNQPDAVTRFRREVHVVATLNHPNIVTAHDADQVGNTHFLVMEYVDGKSLDLWIKQYGRLPIDWACECIRQAAVGLDYAARKGLVHRDIKPANLLVVAGDTSRPPQVKILDLGLARLVSETPLDELTKTDQILGTPDYIAPEQAENTKSADVRSDIYSLGCTLYRLLAGRLPFGGTNAMEKLMARVQTDPPPVSQFHPEVPPALDGIVARMMARRPVDRYQTAREVAEALLPFSLSGNDDSDDSSSLNLGSEAGKYGSSLKAAADSTLQDFLTQLVTQPDQNTPAMAGSKTVPGSSGVRRRDTKKLQYIVWGSIGAAMLLLALVVWLLPSGPPKLALNWPPEERQDAQLFIDGQEVKLAADGALLYVLSEGPHTVKVWRKGYNVEEWNVELHDGDVEPLTPQWERSIVEFKPPKPTDLKPLETVKLKTENVEQRVQAEEAQRKAWTDYQAKRTKALADGEAARREQLAQLEQQFSDAGQAAGAKLDALRADVAAYSLRWPGTAEAARAAGFLASLPSLADPLLRDKVPAYELAAAGEGVAEQAPRQLVQVLGDSRLQHDTAIYAALFSPDGLLLATCSQDATVKLWDPKTGREVRTLRGHLSAVFGIAFSPDGKVLASVSQDKTAKLWDVESGQEGPTLRGHTDQVYCVAFTRDGKRLATGSADKTVKLWNVDTGETIATLPGHADAVLSLACSPIDETIASGSTDKTVMLWDAAAGKTLGPLQKHTQRVNVVRFSPDGKRLASGSNDGTVVLWDVAKREEQFSLKAEYGAQTLAFSSDGKTLIGGGGQFYRTVWLWDLVAGQELPKIETPVSYVDLHPDGKTLVVAGGRQAAIWDLPSSSRRLPQPGHSEAVRTVAFSPDGLRLASGSFDGTVRWWDIATRAQLLDRRTVQINALAYSPDGSWLAVASPNDRLLRILDAATGHERTTLEGVSGQLTSVAVSADGKWLAAGSDDRMVLLWDMGKDKARRELSGHAEPVTSVAFSPDGQMLASGSNDRTVKIWDVASGKERLTLTGHSHPVTSVAFSPNGNTLASASNDFSIKLWDLADGKVRSTLEGHTAAVRWVAFQPDAALLASCGADKTVKLWDAATGQERLTLKMPGVPYSMVFHPLGRYLAVANENGTICLFRLALRAKAG